MGPVSGTEQCPELRAGQPVPLHLEEVATLPCTQGSVTLSASDV